MGKKINLEQILINKLEEYSKEDCNLLIMSKLQFLAMYKAMEEACKQTLELATEKAEVTHNSYMDLVDGCKTYIVDKQSILDVINLIE